MKIGAAGLLITGAVFAHSAASHHGFGTFDMSADIEVTGTFTRIDFVNPHSWVYLDVVEPDGQVRAYRCEMRAATVLRRSGWSPDMFTVGERITITGSPDRNDPNSCYVGTVIFSDGTSVDRYGQRTEAVRPAAVASVEDRPVRRPNGDLNISGDWAPEQRVMTDPRGQMGAMVPLSQAASLAPGAVPEGQAVPAGARGGPPNPRIADEPVSPPPLTTRVTLTDLGRQIGESFNRYSPENPRMRCDTTSILFDWPYDGSINRITQEDDRIILQYGQHGFTRTIHMNMDEHPAEIVPSRGGHSIGRWEDDVLIVDTIGFEPGWINPPIYHGTQLHVVERFTLDVDNMALTREYMATDPEHFVDEYTGSDTVLWPAELPYSPDACEELTFIDFSAQQESGGQPAAAQPQQQESWLSSWWRRLWGD